MIKSNPFTSQKFVSVWCKHFYTNKKIYTPKFLKGISFFKSKKKWPLLVNIGRNLTKGMSYQLLNDGIDDIKQKVYLIYDVPKYFEINVTPSLKNIKIKKIKQYPGFLIHLDNYTDFNDYLKNTFSKSSIQKLNRYNKRLETCFDINEKMLMGTVEKLEYDEVFNHFHQLLTKRFEDKQITNNNLNPEEWLFYKEVAYPLLIENKAALYIIYNETTPISVRLLYFSEDIIFDAITVFDIDYTKFHIGKISIMKMLEWSFKNNYKIFDFSKGYFDYKESWSDLKYDFEYHIIYDSKPLIASLLANVIALSFKTKQYLREKNINEKLHQITFLLKPHSKNKHAHIELLENINFEINEKDLQEITLNDNKGYLKKHVVDFQFLNSEHQKDIKIYQIPNDNKVLYVIKGKINQQILALNK